jgi:hypothetical protein
LSTVSIVGALVGLVALGDLLLQPTQSAGLSARIENWSFWCSTTAALVFGYTSFELLYRDAVSFRLARLPVNPSSLFIFKSAKLYRAHLPLILLPATTGVTLLWSGHTQEYLVAVAVTSSVLVWGLATSIWVHMLAGRSLIRGASDFKGYLLQGMGPPETAFLFYSPGLALVIALSMGLFTELSLRTGLEKGIWKPLIVLAGGFTVAAIWCFLHARRIFMAHQHQIEPRFRDAEVLPPWREGELPRTYLGQGLAALLPGSLAPIWHRLIVQYRRRFRIAIALQVVSAAALGIYILSTAQSLGGIERIAVVAITIGVLVLLPSFRACSGELGQRFDYRALPISRRAVISCHWLLALLEWVPLMVVAIAAAMAAGYGVETLWLAAAIVGGFAVANLIAIPLAMRSAPQTTMMALGVKSALIFGLSVATFAAGFGGA